MATTQSSFHNSRDFLSSLSEQNIQLIASFLDLRSLENLQLINRRMRYLFVSSLWNGLFIITFNPVRNGNEEMRINIIVERQERKNSVEMPLREIYTHKMFRKRWFERYPNLILEERRRQEALERERQAQGENALQNRKNKIERYFDLFNKLERCEIIILFGLYAFVLVFMCLSKDCYACSEDRCSTSLSEKLQNCNKDYRCRKGDHSFLVLELLVVILFYLIFSSFRVFMSPDSGPAFVRERKIIIRTILKLLVYTGVVILYLPLTYIPLSNSECNGFSTETQFGLCTITTTFAVTHFLITSLIFLLGALLQLFNIYLQTYAIYLFRKPIHPLNRPLLLEGPEYLLHFA